MDTETFAASRSGRLDDFDKELRPLVAKALESHNWSDIVTGASVLWLELFEQNAGKTASYGMILKRFKNQLMATLKKTAVTNTAGQIDTITKWVGTFAANDATYYSGRTNGHGSKKWVTRGDSSVRETHREVDGKSVPLGGSFDVGGTEMRYPGEPVADLSLWLNCRCLLQTTEESMTASADTEYDGPLAEFANEPLSEFDDDPGPIPFHGVMAPVGKPSRDGRMFAPDAAHAGPGATLRYQRTEEHGGGNVAVGTISKIFMEDGLIKYQGFFASPDVRPEVNEVIQGLAEGWLSSTSMDLGEFEIGDVADSEFASAYPDVDYFTLAEIAALTVVGIGAFREAYLALGECDCPDEEEAMVASAMAEIAQFAPGTHDGPGWITDPKDTNRIRNYWVSGEGAAKIRWGVPGDFNRCRKHLGKYVTNPNWLAGLCANMHKEAIKVWPGQEDGGRHARLVASAEEYAPALTASAAGPGRIPAAWFEDPKLTGPTPLTVTDEGRVFGHIAAWGTCHIGLPGVCTTPPHSASNYSYFRVGTISTDGGEIPVGQITLGIGHASLSAKPRVAAAHYDNVNSAVADVAVGEDAFGIWFSGSIRGSLEDARIQTLKAAKLSGDWRDMGRGLEMIAALAVNVPGFPIPRNALAASGQHQTALVAAGVIDDEFMLDEDSPLVVKLGIVDAAVAEVERRMELRARAAFAKAALNPIIRAEEISAARKALA